MNEHAMSQGAGGETHKDPRKTRSQFLSGRELTLQIDDFHVNAQAPKCKGVRAQSTFDFDVVPGAEDGVHKIN